MKIRRFGMHNTMYNVLSMVLFIKTAGTTYCGCSSYNKTAYLTIKPNITELVIN